MSTQNDVIVDASVLVQWEILANEAIADAGKWKARARALESALRIISGTAGTLAHNGARIDPAIVNSMLRGIVSTADEVLNRVQS
jgi:hypothetical protein